MRLKVVYLERGAVGATAARSYAARETLPVETSLVPGTLALDGTLLHLAADDGFAHGKEQDDDQEFLQIRRA